MDIDDLIIALGDDYKERFPQSLGDLWIKRVTPTVPEAITEWPWLYFVVGDGDVTDLTYGAVQDVAPTRALVPPHVIRNHLLIVHRFKAQLLVRPRRDLVEDETLVRPFITPLLQVAAEKRRGNDGLGLIDL